ncbi:MAG: ribose 5-phosphate isomerase B [Brevinemataceae bacterium]
MIKKIALGCDHGGYELKEKLKSWLEKNNYQVEDFGTFSEESVDYTDFIYPASKSVAMHNNDAAIVLCGTGLGAAYTANKVHGIRAALCQDEFSARLSRLHNNANVLVLGGRILAYERALSILETWLEAPFEGGRHQQRIDKISQIEKKENSLDDSLFE